MADKMYPGARADAGSHSERRVRPRWVFSKGDFTDEDLAWLGSAPTFAATKLQVDPNRDVKPILQVAPAFSGDPPRKFLVDRHEINGEVYCIRLERLNFDYGNSEFFDPHDTARIRLRPLIPNDRGYFRKPDGASAPWFGGGVNSLLWVDHPDGSGAGAFLVSLFPRGSPEASATVARAVEYVRREYGSEQPRAVALLSSASP